MFKNGRIFIGLIITVIMVLLFTSQAVPNNVNGFFADAGSFEILSSYQGKNNVLKVDGSKVSGQIAYYSLSGYKGKLITIEFTAEMRREGASGNLNWQVNNDGTWPSVASMENATTGTWHRINGKLIINPTNNNTLIYLTNWENNYRNTTYYIANPIVTITEGDGLTPDFSLTPLKTIYANDFFMGIGDFEQFMLDGDIGNYSGLMKHHFNMAIISPYPSTIAPSNKGGAYQWTWIDNKLKFFLDNNFKVHGHTLVWHESSPSWLTEGSREEVLQNMNNYISTVLNHYKGKITSWNVVNEAIKHEVSAAEARGDWKRCVRRSDVHSQNPWFEKLGVDYIELAFRAARAVDPDIKLYYNDYGLENINKAEAVRKMIQDINDRYKRETGGTRNLIEGVGSQAHIYEYNRINLNDVRASLEKLISLGIEVAITELDVSAIAYNRGIRKDTIMSERDQIAQGVFYAGLMNLYKQYSSNITSVTFWGLDDSTSWLSAGNPLLFDRNLNAKKSFYAVSDPDGFLRQYGGSTRR